MSSREKSIDYIAKHQKCYHRIGKGKFRFQRTQLQKGKVGRPITSNVTRAEMNMC